MAYFHNEKKYSSKKHPVLEYIFRKKNPQGTSEQKAISFTLKDISDGYKDCGIDEPASISNTILDLTRKRRDITARLPESIILLGYDIQKKTGKSADGSNYAGEFVFVGVGNQIESWLEWTSEFEEIEISSSKIPEKIKSFLRNDEGALFSVIDYCDVFSLALFNKPNSVLRVQNPMKWQPNEIDGCYFAEVENQDFLLPVEAKALTTGDDINLVQMQGALNTISERFRNYNIKIIPLAIKMVKNGIEIFIFKQFHLDQEDNLLGFPERAIKVVFLPAIEVWQ